MSTDKRKAMQPDQQLKDEVLQVEWQRIFKRRIRATGKEQNATDGSGSERPHDLVGLALSGGGIRSASFNLGLLQGLYYFDGLKGVDYLSTVSGGGYIGACMTWFGSRLGKRFPLVWRDPNDPKEHEQVRDHLQHLRAHGSYLVPGDGLNLWSLIAAIVAGSLTTLVVLLPLFVGLVGLLSQRLFGMSLFEWAGQLAVIILGLFTTAVFIYAIVSSLGVMRQAKSQRAIRGWFGNALPYALLLLTLGSVPWAYDTLAAHIDEWRGWVMSGISGTGILSVLGGLIGAKEESEVRLIRSSLLSLGLLLVIFGLTLWLYHLVQTEDIFHTFEFWGVLTISVLVALLANINHVSMHRYYRNRLREAFMPPDPEQPDKDPDQCFLHEIDQTEFPYHIINANIQTVGSESERLRQRGGDSFILTPEYCGSSATGYIATKEYVGGSMNLATAMAISGAAADTNSYATRSRPLVFLMTLFNVRLGYWIRNPRHTSRHDQSWIRRNYRPLWYWYLLREVFGRGLDEYAWNIRLSDGGHFENLGLYELIKRRCKLIIVSDAGRDPDFSFADLGRAVERARVDFGALIDIDLSGLRPNPSGTMNRPFEYGTIRYAPDINGKTDTGSLVYIKSALIEKMTPDVVAYKEEHKEFPDESTSDQFFSELQFEAYRELGINIARDLCNKGDPEILGLLGLNCYVNPRF